MENPIHVLLRSSVHQFIGRLGKDPQVRFLDNGKCVANVNIGMTQLANKDETDWVKLEVWGDAGQAFADAAHKGDLVNVAGRVKTDRWTDRSTGEERSQLCCRVEQWKVISTPQPAQQQQQQQSASAPLASPDGDGIPF